MFHSLKLFIIVHTAVERFLLFRIVLFTVIRIILKKKNKKVPTHTKQFMHIYVRVGTLYIYICTYIIIIYIHIHRLQSDYFVSKSIKKSCCFF